MYSRVKEMTTCQHEIIWTLSKMQKPFLAHISLISKQKTSKLEYNNLKFDNYEY